MALGDVLAARAQSARATAQIECGSLGTVSLEALSVRDLEQLSRGADAERAIFYAACRDLQRAGAQLLQAGKVYRPDQVTEYVSDEEAREAAQAVRELSGVTAEASPAGEGNEPPFSFPLAEKKTAARGQKKRTPARIGEESDEGLVARVSSEPGERTGGGRYLTATESAGADEAGGGGAQVLSAGGQVSRETGLSEVSTSDKELSQIVRHQIVQENEEVRHDTVQQDLTESAEIRLSSVQADEEILVDGQVSREFLTQFLTEDVKTDKSQVLWLESAQTPQNVVEMDKMDSGLLNIGGISSEKPAVRKVKKTNRVHEIESEIGAEKGRALHEITSEMTGAEAQSMHENESEISELLHENTSESGEKMHESKSESAEMLHENESELAQRIARALLEGLRGASWVR